MINEVDKIYNEMHTDLSKQQDGIKSYVEKMNNSVGLPRSLLEKGSIEEVLSSQKMIEENIEHVKNESPKNLKPVHDGKIEYESKKIDDLNVDDILEKLGEIADHLTRGDLLNDSIILEGKNDYISQMKEWLGDQFKWRRCYRATKDGWGAQDFHGCCDDKQPTVSLVKVGDNICGGYTDQNFTGNEWKQSNSSFLFSLQNKDNLPPFRSVVSGNNRNAIRSNPDYGPSFGGGRDFHISHNSNHNQRSYSRLGYTYQPPPGYQPRTAQTKSLLAGSYNFTPTEVEDVFLCMLRNLFEEYGHFHNYPNRELHTTACLFGGIIDQGLVTYMVLGIALRYVLDAIRKPFQSKMYLFGITALDRFRMRLKDYQHYCRHLASIPHFGEFPAHLVEFIEYGKQALQPPLSSRSLQDTSSTNYFGKASSSLSDVLPSVPSVTPAISGSVTTTVTSGLDVAKQFALSGGVSSNAPTRKEPSIANANNIDTLLGATESSELAQPSEPVQDKVHFVFNNISQTNLTQKNEEIKEAVKAEFFPWLSQYLVMKRVSIEPNFHDLYIKFLEALKLKELFQMVLQETYRNIKVLLQSDKVPANFSDRSLLKNLGHWLGLMTLSQNKPVLMRNLDVKSLIIEAFFKGQQEMLYVVPFVAKIMEGCSKSKIFKPPNPWVMAVMGVLVELHQVPDLKLNLKFEVEVLCNTLNIDMKEEIMPTELLKDPEKLNHITHQLSSPDKERQAGSSSSLTQVPPTTPPPPQYSYQEINVASLAGLAAHIKVNPQIVLFQHQPQLRQYVRPAIERAVQELIHPVVERSIKICLTTAEMIVKKDFALDPDESRMRNAAHSMVRFMTAGMALITCREPLNVSINNNLRSTLIAALRGATIQQKEAIDNASQIVSEENTELACTFIQKTAVEKALPEMDKRLASEFELRRLARSEGRRYCDPVVLTYQAERMPEQIRLKVGGVTPNQTAVFEEFAKSIPGFVTPTPGENLSAPSSFSNSRSVFEQNLHGSEPSIMSEEVSQILGKCTAEIEQHLHAMNLSQNSPHGLAILGLLEILVTSRAARDNVAVVRVVHKAVKGLLEGLNPIPSDTELALRYRDCHLVVLRSLQDPRGYGPHWIGRHVTKFVCECPPDLKFNVDVIDILIRSRLINMREFDMHLAQCIENDLSIPAIHFAIQLTKLYLVDEHSNHVSQGDLYQTLEALSRISNSRNNLGEGLPSILEVIRSGGIGSGIEFPQRLNDLDKSSGSQVGLSFGLSGLRIYEDPPGLHDKVEYLLREWVRLYHQPAAGKESEKAFSSFVAMLHQHGILKTDDLITRFFRISTELCVEVTYRALIDHSTNRSHARAKCFNTLDAYCRLIALLVRHSGDASNSVTKINLLTRVLGTVVQVLIQDHEMRKTDFHQLAYHRIFIILLLELNQPEPVLEAINYQVLQTFSTIFHALRPSRAPGFAYAWLELISHRLFMSKLLLNTPQQKGWVLFQQLLIDLFKFLAPFLRNAELTKPTHLLYKGTLRVLLVLLHDFPEFLCDYHFSFCDVIPPNCIQMRNLILSAFPRNMRLPDPFTPNLKVDLLTDIAHSPRILTNFANAIQPATFKKELDSYLKTRAPVTFLTELRSHLQVATEPGTRYNVPLMNALVLYVGTQAIAYIHSKSGTPSMSTITHSSHMDIFQNLAVDLDTEGRYLFLNAVANQLRYPNSHTHYFSCVLLYLFAEANTEAIQEQITRVLLERLIVNRPHPWGLLITFIELIKNHQYKFWTHDFVHCAPEIEKLFESVARSCMQQKQPQNRDGNETT